MKLTIADPALLKPAMNVMNEYLADALFEIQKDTITISGWEKSKVCYVKHTLHSAACIEFQVDEEEPFMVRMDRLAKIIKAAGSNDIITLKTDDDFLHVTLKGSSKTSYKLKKMQDESQDPYSDDFKCAVSCDSGSFKEAMDRCNVLAPEAIQLNIMRGVFSMTSADDNDECLVEFNDDNSEVKRDQKAKGRYSKDYLISLKGAVELADKVDIDLGMDLPVRLVFQQPDKLRFIAVIAPRVGDE